MAKGKTDYGDAVSRILGIDAESESSEELLNGGSTPERQHTDFHEKPDVSKRPLKLVHKSFDITPEQHKALKQRAINDDSLNLSGHLRAALDAYLEHELAELKNK